MQQNQYAAHMYTTVMFQGMRSEDIWVVALEYLVRKLRQAQAARRHHHFEEAFQCHQRILSVLAVLHSYGKSAPERVQHDTRAEASSGNAAILAFYDHVRRVISGIAMHSDYDARYDALINQTLALCERLRGAFNHQNPNENSLMESVKI